MIRRRSGLAVPALLLVACLALAWLIYEQLGEAAPTLEPAARAGAQQAAPAAAAQPEIPQFSMPRVETFAAIVERPIFSPTRRPPPEAEVTLDDAFSNLDLLLVGVVISADERIAIVLPKNHTDVVRLGVGDLFQGWVVHAIEADRVTFRRDDLEEQIELTYDRPPPRNTKKIQGPRVQRPKIQGTTAPGREAQQAGQQKD
jgi:hypothetical protein